MSTMAVACRKRILITGRNFMAKNAETNFNKDFFYDIIVYLLNHLLRILSNDKKKSDETVIDMPKWSQNLNKCLL